VVGAAGIRKFCYGDPKGMAGGSGGVRVVWPGATRQFPTTCVGSP
jgi:hypothetical protein